VSRSPSLSSNPVRSTETLPHRFRWLAPIKRLGLDHMVCALTGSATTDIAQTAAESTQSAVAANCDLECVADLMHPLVAKSAETFDECGERHALDGIEIHD